MEHKTEKPKDKDELDKIARRVDAFILAVALAFRTSLNEIAQRAQGRVMAQLASRLAMKTAQPGAISGAIAASTARRPRSIFSKPPVSRLNTKAKLKGQVIAISRANNRQLQNIPDLLTTALNESGFQALLDVLTGKFDDQLRFAAQVIASVRRDAGEPPRALQLSQADHDAFSSSKLATRLAIASVLTAAGAAAAQRVLLSPGLTLNDVADELATRLSPSVEEAAVAAATGMASYYRTVLEKVFERVEANLGEGKTLEWRYYGPLDGKTRPFCRKLLRANRAYTRKEIDAMDNGQLPNVFITGGGFNCRHSWFPAIVPATSDSPELSVAN